MIDLEHHLIKSVLQAHNMHAGVKRYRATGSASADIAVEITYPGLFFPISLRVHFASGSGSADLTIDIDSAISSSHDTRLHTEPAVGTDTSDVNIGFSDGYFPDWRWAIQGPEVLDINWTNPSTSTWGLEMAFLVLHRPGAKETASILEAPRV